MGERRVDDDTVDRILAGLVDPVDAPPGYEAAVTLIVAARGVPVPAPRPLARPTRRSALPVRPSLSILAAAVVLGGASGAAVAAGLPAAASATARGVLQSLGVASGPRTHPVSGSSEAHRPAVSAPPPATGGTAAAGRVEAPPAAAAAGRSDTRRHARRRHHGHGAAISALAHSTTGTAGTKGATISAAASGGKSHAGEHGHNGKSEASHGHGHGRGRPHGPR